jgi:sugar lactone lactonase YvrE
MYVVGTTSDRVWQYELSTTWQVNTATHTAGANVSVSAQDANPQSICFNNTGSKMYMAGNTNKRIYEYDLSTPWQVNSATHTATANLALSGRALVGGATFSANGHKLYIATTNTTFAAVIMQYNCSTPYRINNATLDTEYQVLPIYANGGFTGAGAFNGMCFRPDGNTLYTASANAIQEYDMDPQTLRIKSILPEGTAVITSNATHVIIS